MRVGSNETNVHHGVDAGTPRTKKSSRFRARQLSKWFYNIFTSTATRAARCGSFLEGLRTLALQLWMKQGGHDDVTWFGPVERKTLHPREEFVLLCVFFKLALNWPEKA
jgi:hypothetical protein